MILESAYKAGIKHEEFFEQYGKALFYQKKLDKALLFFEKILQKDATNKSVLNLMGISLKDLGRFDEALKYYNLAIKLDPNDTKILYNKCVCFMKLKQFDKAKKICETILKIDSTHQKALEKLKEIEKLSKKG